MPHLDTPAGPPTDSAAPAARPAGAIPGRAETDRLREIHKGIKGVDAAGRRYHALNPEAYLWVHATLYHGMVETQCVFGRPLGPVKEAALLGEWRDLAPALGITDRHLPHSPVALRAMRRARRAGGG